MIKNTKVRFEKKIDFTKKDFEKIILNLQKKYQFTISVLQVNFVESDFMIELNNKFLKHNYDTDILTFNYSSEEKNICAEIYISIEMAMENAKKFKVTNKHEFYRLVIHGILHLLGFNDKTPKQKKIMKLEEETDLKEFGF